MGRSKNAPPPITKLVVNKVHEKSLGPNLLDGLDWATVYRLWRERMEDLAAPIQPLIEEVVIRRPGRDREPDLVWWPRKTFREKLLRCQEHFDKLPNTLGPTHPVGAKSQGQLHTLYLLNALDGHPEKQAAVMISASLFERLGYRGRGDRYPERWPPRLSVEALRTMVREVWREIEYDWHHASTQVIPMGSNDWSYHIGDLRSLVRYLAEEHAALLHQQVPTRVVFCSSPTPHLRGV